MARLPNKLAGNGLITSAVNALIDCVRESVPRESMDTFMERGPLGTTRRPSRFIGSLNKTASGESVKLTILSFSGDWILCEDEAHTNYSVAKWPQNRTSLTSEVIDGTTMTYAYTTSNQRSASDGTNTQNEVLYWRYQVGQTIFAMKPKNKTGVFVSAVELEWVEMSPRVWLRKYYQ